MDQNLVFWSKALDGIRETDGFQPEARRVPLTQTERRRMAFRFSADTSEAFRRISRDKKQNLFVALSAGGAAVLAKYCFSEKVVYAAPALLAQKGSGIRNRLVLCVTSVTRGQRFTDLVRASGTFYQEALRHQNVAEEILADTLELKSTPEVPMIRTLMLMRGIHDESCIAPLCPDTALLFDLEDGVVTLTLDYNSTLYSEAFIRQLGTHLLRFFDLCAAQPDRLLSETDVLTEAEHLTLSQFQGKDIPLAEGESVLTAFRASVARFGERTALVEKEERVTYAQLDAMSDRIAGFIFRYADHPQYVGVYMRNGIRHIAAILGVLKAGAAYVPIDYDLPYDRIKSIFDDIELTLAISLEEHIPYLNKLQNECSFFRQYLCLDTGDVYRPEERSDNDLSDRKLWEFVGERSSDSIEGGGWQSSYTGENLSAEEMAEYGENVRLKLTSYLRPDQKALEVGCASGITMFRIAPLVGSYFGTDLAQAILDKDMQIIREKQIHNITLAQVPALEIDTIPESGFDVIIVNSVIQCFNGYNYFRKVLEKLLRLSADKALIFFGDVMDADKKDALITSLREFAAQNAGKGYTTKTDWSQELFFSQTFFRDLRADHPEITDVVFSDKIGTIRNELTDFRYDVMLFVDKTAQAAPPEKQLGQFGSGILDGCEQYVQETVLQDADPAYVIYTSGTTGKPKGIEIRSGALMRFCKWNNRFYELNEHDVTTRYARVGFDAAVWELFPALCAGSEIHVIPEEMRLDLCALADYFNRHGVTFSFLPTQMFEQFMEQENHSLRVVATGGDKLSTVREVPYRIVNNYGPTETTIVVTAMEVHTGMTTLPIGRPIDNVRIHILDRCGLMQPVGTVGEICIAGPNLAKRYVNLPELTEEKFCSGAGCGEERIYRSGDLGRWLPDGTIEYFGRMDGQIKISAFRIEMEEISTALCEMNCISQAVVRAVTDEGNSRSLVAYAVTDNESITADEIRAYLRTRLPEYMIPAYFFLMKQFPVTPNGKTDYAKLPDPRSLAAKRDLVQPETETEARLLEAFRRTLDTERIGVTDSFFECGGNSIKAIKLVADLTQGFDVTINDVFTYQSVRALADHITAREQNLDGKFEAVREALDTIAGEDLTSYHRKKHDAYLQTSIGAQIQMHPDKYRCVLLTGATGFLGINLLRRLLFETNAAVCAVVRGADSRDAAARLAHKWEHQFGEPLPESCCTRLTVLAGDLMQPQFGLSDADYQKLAADADCIIHTAANVRHYGHHEEFSGINSDVIRTLAAFAETGTRKELHHVSTIGIAEGVIPDTPFFLFTEQDGDSGQILTNYYTETKLQAERYVQEARSHGIRANIYRVGNLIADSRTGIFQENIDTNGFYKTLRAMLLMRTIPDTSVRMLDFSFIDQIAEAMIRLVFSDDAPNQTYHLFNPQQVSMNTLSELLREVGMKVEILSAGAFLDKLHTLYDDPVLGDPVKEFILHTRLFSIPEETHFTLTCEKTCEKLAKLGFVWKAPDAQILQRMLAHCAATGFLPMQQEV